jgi:hypothetical protein
MRLQEGDRIWLGKRDACNAGWAEWDGENFSFAHGLFGTEIYSPDDLREEVRMSNGVLTNDERQYEKQQGGGIIYTWDFQWECIAEQLIAEGAFPRGK